MKLKLLGTQVEKAQQPISTALYPEYYQIVKRNNKNHCDQTRKRRKGECATIVVGLPDGWSLL